jgi:hypothetical protein
MEALATDLNQRLGLDFTLDQWHMCFLLINKAEFHTDDPDTVFETKEGTSVWTHCEAIQYDRYQRGCHIGWGFVTGGTDQESTIRPVLEAVAQRGGPDLVDAAATCYTSKECAIAFCDTVRQTMDAETFQKAQVEVLCSPGGYMYEAKTIIQHLDIDVSPLIFVAVLDSMIDFGLGSRKYCPRKFMINHGIRKKHVRTLENLLSWKRWISTKNNHNSCKHNGLCRANMYKTLLRKQAWTLPRSRCEEVVKGFRVKPSAG